MRKVSWLSIIMFLVSIFAFTFCSFVSKDVNLQLYYGFFTLAVFIHIENRTDH